MLWPWWYNLRVQVELICLYACVYVYFVNMFIKTKKIKLNPIKLNHVWILFKNIHEKRNEKKERTIEVRKIITESKRINSNGLTLNSMIAWPFYLSASFSLKLMNVYLSFDWFMNKSKSSLRFASYSSSPRDFAGLCTKSFFWFWGYLLNLQLFSCSFSFHLKTFCIQYSYPSPGPSCPLLLAHSFGHQIYSTFRSNQSSLLHDTIGWFQYCVDYYRLLVLLVFIPITL